MDISDPLQCPYENQQVAKHIRLKSQNKDHHGAQAEYGKPYKLNLASLRTSAVNASAIRATRSLDVPPASSPNGSSLLQAALLTKKPMKQIVVGPKVGIKVPHVAKPQASQTLGAGLLEQARKPASTGVNGHSVVVSPAFAGELEISPKLRSTIEKMTANGVVLAKAGPGPGAQAPVSLVDKATSPQKSNEPRPFIIVPSAASSSVSNKSTSHKVVL
jgi:hypothetical protein